MYKRQRNLVNNKKKQAKEKLYANVNDNLSDLKTNFKAGKIWWNGRIIVLVEKLLK
jgi:hypothetical protein